MSIKNTGSLNFACPEFSGDFLDINLCGIFDYVRGTTWPDDTPNQVVIERAAAAFADITANNYTKEKKLYRIAGQSGSGKTTQLLPTVLEYEKQCGHTPVIVAVRNFVKYHPKYNELANTCQAGQIRELTNGFALKCLAATLKLLVENGYLIIFDMTILAPEFESFVYSLLCKNNYQTIYHILAVGKRLSQSFIAKRMRAGQEGGRIVKRESSNYFYDILPLGLACLGGLDAQRNFSECKKAPAKKDSGRNSTRYHQPECFVWTAYDLTPIYIGNLGGTAKALEQGRAKTGRLKFTEDELRRAKLEFLHSFR